MFWNYKAWKWIRMKFWVFFIKISFKFWFNSLSLSPIKLWLKIYDRWVLMQKHEKKNCFENFEPKMAKILKNGQMKNINEVFNGFQYLH